LGVERYEIYSRVEFEAREILSDSTRSDFDLLVGLPDQVLMAECKSGGITSDACQRMIANATLLRRIFGRMGFQHAFLLVFNPTGDADEHQRLCGLHNAGFTIVDLSQLGPFLHAHITGQPLRKEMTWSP
jgi:hypothetical protein